MADDDDTRERARNVIGQLKWVEDITKHNSKLPTEDELGLIGNVAEDAYVVIRLLLRALDASPKPRI